MRRTCQRRVANTVISLCVHCGNPLARPPWCNESIAMPSCLIPARWRRGLSQPLLLFHPVKWAEGTLHSHVVNVSRDVSNASHVQVGEPEKQKNMAGVFDKSIENDFFQHYGLRSLDEKEDVVFITKIPCTDSLKRTRAAADRLSVTFLDDLHRKYCNQQNWPKSHGRQAQ